MLVNSSHVLAIPASLALFRIKFPDSFVPRGYYLGSIQLSVLCSPELCTQRLLFTHIGVGYYQRKDRFH